jgi:hypothetical protein
MNDVVMVQLRRELGFVDEHVDEFLVVGEVRQDLLDGDNLLKSLHPPHPSLPDFSHTAGGNLLDQHILTKSNTVGVVGLIDLRFGGKRRREDGRGDGNFLLAHDGGDGRRSGCRRNGCRL